MATPTYAELLAQTKEAIQTILVGGQSYKIGPRELTRADLKELFKTAEWLEWQVARESGGDNGIGLVSFGDPS